MRVTGALNRINATVLIGLDFQGTLSRVVSDLARYDALILEYSA